MILANFISQGKFKHADVSCQISLIPSVKGFFQEQKATQSSLPSQLFSKQSKENQNIRVMI